MTNEDNLPDLFADSINVATGQYGVTLTLYLSDPTPEDRAGSPQPLGRKVGRVRITPQLARDLIPLITQGLEALERLNQPAATAEKDK